VSNPLDGKTKGEQDFLKEYTRTRLVMWCAREMRGKDPFMPEEDRVSVFADVAEANGWVRKDRAGVTSKGYSVAAAYLRR
jgi:hypothetical protein